VITQNGKFIYASVLIGRIRKFAKSDDEIRRLSAWDNSPPAGRIFMKVYI